MENWESELEENTRGGQLPEQAPEQPASPTGAQARRDASAGRELYLNVRVLVTMMGLFVLLFTFVARVIVVSGPSMQNTLFGGDLILVCQWVTPRSRGTWWCLPKRATRRTPL